MQENKILNEDEIDLRELFKTIWDKRFFYHYFYFYNNFNLFYLCFTKKSNTSL